MMRGGAITRLGTRLDHRRERRKSRSVSLRALIANPQLRGYLEGGSLDAGGAVFIPDDRAR